MYGPKRTASQRILGAALLRFADRLDGHFSPGANSVRSCRAVTIFVVL